MEQEFRIAGVTIFRFNDGRVEEPKKPDLDQKIIRGQYDQKQNQIPWYVNTKTMSEGGLRYRR